MSIYRQFLEPASNEVDSYVVVHTSKYHCKLKIADCNRSVSLFFTDYDLVEARDEKQVNKLVKTYRTKIARLRKALDLVEEDLNKKEAAALDKLRSKSN